MRPSRRHISARVSQGQLAYSLILGMKRRPAPLMGIETLMRSVLKGVLDVCCVNNDNPRDYGESAVGGKRSNIEDRSSKKGTARLFATPMNPALV